MSACVTRIVTDSSADIPPEIARRLDITVIPCQIHLGGQTYRDGVDISHEDFYRRLRVGEKVTTSQPAVGDFVETYRRVLSGCDQVIAIHLGSTFSGLHATAQAAAAEVGAGRVTVIDSEEVSMAIGWLVMHAAEAAGDGLAATEIIAQARALVPRLRLYAMVDDLHFLHRGGRVGWVSGMIGSLFAIKPILLINRGRADLIEKVRSLNRGVERLAALAEGLGPLERIAVLHADNDQGVSDLIERISRWFPRDSLLVNQAGAVVTAHAGPGAVGFACLTAG